MKFALVFLLGLFVLQATAFEVQHKDQKAVPALRDSLWDKLKEYIEAIIQKATETINLIVEKAQEIYNSIKDQVEALVEEAQKTLKKIIQEIEDKLNEWAQQGEAAEACVEKYRPELDAAVAEAQKDISDCADHAYKQAQDILDGIVAHVDEIKVHFNELWDVLVECVDILHPIDSIRCVMDRSKEIKESIEGIIANAWNSLAEAAEKSVAIVTESSACISGAVSNAQSKIDEIYEKIEKCIDATKY